jgi:hypothetical protein
VTPDERFRCEPQHAVLRRNDCAQQYREANAAAAGSAVAVRKALCRGCTVGIVHVSGIGVPPPAVPMPTPAGAPSTRPQTASNRPHRLLLQSRAEVDRFHAKEMTMTKPKPSRDRECRDCGQTFQWTAPAQLYCGACKDKRVAAQKGKRKAPRKAARKAHFPAAPRARRTDGVQTASVPRTDAPSILEDVTSIVRVLARHDREQRLRLLRSAHAILEAVS